MRPPRVHVRMRVVLVTIAPSASGNRNATRASSNGSSTGNVPRAVGRRLAARAQVAAHADERGARAAVDEPARDEIGRETLADAAEVDARAAREAHA